MLHLSTKLGRAKGIEEKFIPYTHQNLKSETQIILKGLWQLQVKTGTEFSMVPTVYIAKVGFYCCILLCSF